MKLIVRAFVFALVATGASAAAVSFHSTQAVATTTLNNQAVASAMPTPWCNPTTSGGKCTVTN
jgi:hypothetical protein